MVDVHKAFSAIVKRVLFIGFSIQIVLGIFWMLGNFAGFQKFGESALYVEISRNLICDEYEGILYPVLIMTARGIEEAVLIPYRCILYLLQLLLAYIAAWRLLRRIPGAKKFSVVWGSLAMLTYPLAMQCHLAVLPDSLTASCLLLELSCAWEILQKEEQLRAGQFMRVLSFWLLSALLRPEYLYLGGIPALFMFVYGVWKAWKTDRRQMIYNGILVLAFAGMIVSVGDLARAEGYYGRAHKSVSASLVSRCVWPRAGRDYEYWPDEVKETIFWQQALQIDYYADNMKLLFDRTLESAVGEERAEELFLEVADIAWNIHKSEILHDAIWDAVGYILSPVVVQRQFTGKVYDSYSGRNYDIMRGRTPFLSKYYLNYGCWWFAVGLLLAAAVLLVSVIRRICEMRKHIRERQKSRPCLHVGRIFAVLIGLWVPAGLAVQYTLQGAGMMDYKKTTAVGLLWTLWMLFSCIADLSAQNGESKRHGE